MTKTGSSFSASPTTAFSSIENQLLTFVTYWLLPLFKGFNCLWLQFISNSSHQMCSNSVVYERTLPESGSTWEQDDELRRDGTIIDGVLVAAHMMDI